jgi:hypothetical protein
MAEKWNPGARANAAGAGENAVNAKEAGTHNVAQDAADANFAVALELARQGLPLFPCGPDKRPLLRWKEAATADIEAVAAMWRQSPGALVGLLCGQHSGVYVLDADTDRATGERIGGQSLAALGFGHLLTDACQPRVRTPSGGVHPYFRYSGEGLGNTAGKLGPKLDTRGDSGYIVAPGTVAPAGRYAPENPIDWCALPPCRTP